MKYKLHPFVVAGKIVPNSYISFESALSYYGWIPESVYTVCSVIKEGESWSIELTKEMYEYTYLPVNKSEFLTGVTKITLTERQPDNPSFLIATPLRAITDYIYARIIKGINIDDWLIDSIDWLTASLRIEDDELNTITLSDVQQLRLVYNDKKIHMFLDDIQKYLTQLT